MDYGGDWPVAGNKRRKATRVSPTHHDQERHHTAGSNAKHGRGADFLGTDDSRPTPSLATSSLQPPLVTPVAAPPMEPRFPVTTLSSEGEFVPDWSSAVPDSSQHLHDSILYDADDPHTSEREASDDEELREDVGPSSRHTAVAARMANMSDAQLMATSATDI